MEDLNKKIFEKTIIPNWPAPLNVKAFSSTRVDMLSAHLSTGVYQGLNLGQHVGDDPKIVLNNRQRIQTALNMPSDPIWLSQVHSNQVLSFEGSTDEIFEADGSFTQTPRVVCCVMTADCVPILLTDKQGKQVAAVHAGWRGLASGVIENAIEKFARPNQVMAWIGPAIGPSFFEVGQDVYDAFVGNDDSKDSGAAKAFQFHPTALGKYFADMDQLVTLRLNRLGVTEVYSSQMCTFENTEQFYSYRRDGQTGRQASFIWIES